MTSVERMCVCIDNRSDLVELKRVQCSSPSDAVLHVMTYHPGLLVVHVITPVTCPRTGNVSLEVRDGLALKHNLMPFRNWCDRAEELAELDETPGNRERMTDHWEELVELVRAHVDVLDKAIQTKLCSGDNHDC